jgi:hypothetical protein
VNEALFGPYQAPYQWVREATLLRVEVGSTVHGIGTGLDDRDEMGICIEPLPLAYGLVPELKFNHYIYRTAAERTGVSDAPSEPGDLDLTIFPLRRWLDLALGGNPNTLIPLFAPRASVFAINALGYKLRELAPAFASKRAGSKMLAYMRGQRERLMGKRGQKNVNRQELVDRHGFDTKYAGHMVRLGYQTCEYLCQGKLTLPMSVELRRRCVAIREGRVPLIEVLREANDLEAQALRTLTVSSLPDLPDVGRVEAWMLDVYLEHWKCGWGHERSLARLHCD